MHGNFCGLDGIARCLSTLKCRRGILMPLEYAQDNLFQMVLNACRHLVGHCVHLLLPQSLSSTKLSVSQTARLSPVPICPSQACRSTSRATAPLVIYLQQKVLTAMVNKAHIVLLSLPFKASEAYSSSSCCRIPSGQNSTLVLLYRNCIDYQRPRCG